MTTLVFDTHDFVRRLHDAGFSETQAEILTQLQQESVDATLEQFHNIDAVTKQDLRETELALKHNLREAELKLELKIVETHTAIAQTKAELIRWVIGVGMLQTALITALLLKVSSGL